MSGASLEHSSSVEVPTPNYIHVSNIKAREVPKLNYITVRAIPPFGNIKSDLVWQKRGSFVFVSGFVIFKFS